MKRFLPIFFAAIFLTLFFGSPLCNGAVSASSSTRIYTFADYGEQGQFYYTFYAGYEFLDVNTTLDKGSPRIGFMANMKYGGYVSTATAGWHPLTYGVCHSFTARLTSSAEQKVSDSTATAAPDEEKAFEFETQLFWPLAQTELRDVQCHFGLLGVLGGKKTKRAQVDARYYGGYRVAKNPEFYTDFLCGRTLGLDSLRLEVKGQLPVKRFSEESELFLARLEHLAFKNLFFSKIQSGSLV